MEGLEERVLLSLSPTLTTLSVPTTAALVGQPLSFTANVTLPGTPSVAPSGGTVNFMDGNVCLGTAPLVAGQASLTNSLFTAGTQTVTASYNGNAVGLAGSTSVGQDLSVANDGSTSAVAGTFALPCYESISGDNSNPQSTAGPTGMTPTQIRQAYGFSSLSFGSQAADGTGTTIAIVDAYDDPTAASDLTAFDTQFGIAAPPSFTKVNQTGGTSYPAANSGWINEIALDVEWSHAVAPGANILLVEANSNNNSDLYAAVNYARHVAGVVAVSMSWGGGESSTEASSDSYFTTPSGHAGVTFLASSGDTGAPPIYPSISPNVVSVGGTSLYLTAQNAYSSESGWSGSGGGISAYESQPAYQNGVVTQSTTYRTDPDVSYDANPNTGFPVYDAYNNGTVTPWGQWGGTSDAAPQWAALVAIADQGRTLAGLGSLDGASQTLPLLYAMSQSDFHDVTSGTSTGYPNYSAGTGYDLVTGRGTPQANLIVPYLVAQTAFPTSTAVGVSSGTITYGQSVTLTATVSVVSPNTGTPNGGTVTFLDDGTAIGSAPLTGGTATLTTSALNYGVQEITASYSGYGTSFWPSTGGLSSASIVTTVAGNGVGDGATATAAKLTTPDGVAVDSAGDLFIADTYDNRIREVNYTTGVITTVAGNGTQGSSGDGGLATAAELSLPIAVALDSAGNLYIADWDNSRVRKVNLTTGIITTVAGGGSTLGDGGQATAAQLGLASGVAVDASGDIFVADELHDRIREVLPSGIITTVAGTGTGGYNGDGISATAAELYQPMGVAVDSSGNLYIADAENARVREVIASSGLIATVAGTGTAGYSNDGAAATAAKLDLPCSVAVDASGDVFIADDYNFRVREVYVSSGTIATVAGTGVSGFSGDGGAANAAKLTNVPGVGIDSSGNLYIADCGNNRIREVSSGTINTVAGGYLGDSAAATAAILSAPYGSAVDSAGDLFVADTSDNRVREINHATGLITTVAGTGVAGYNGTNIQATAATLSSPRGVAIDSSGNLYVADSGNNRIREVNLSTGVITTIAGNGTAGYTGDGGAATAAEFNDPYSITLDGSGDLFIADYSNQRIREVNLSSHVITTIAGGGVGDGQPATTAPLDLPQNLAVDSSGNLYIADTSNNRIREVSRVTGLISTVAGTGIAGYNGDNIAATAAELNQPYDVVLDSAGDLYIADYFNNRIREVIRSTGQIITVAGTGAAGYGGDNGPATAAKLYYPKGIALDGSGDLFIADNYNYRIREVKTSGTIITVAGTGSAYYNGDNIPAVTATIYSPTDVAVDSAGNLYIADTGNDRIREVLASSGQIITVAGNGTAGYAGDGGLATAAKINYPEGIALDASGDLFLADDDNARIREVYAATGTIATVAGNGASAFSGDGGAATAAGLYLPGGLAVDSSGNLLIADTHNDRIREVLASSGVINTVAGNGSASYGGDGGAATAAVLSKPTGVAVDPAGNLYIADSGNQRVRKINLSSGLITTVAGDGSYGYSGDGGVATAAMLDSPQGVAVDPAGNLYIADTSNNCIREVSLATGIISTIAGGALAGYSGDGGPVDAVLLSTPTGIAVDAAGNLYIADSGNNRIREVAVGGVTVAVGPAAAASTSLAFGTSFTTTYGGSLPLTATLLCGGVGVSGETITFTCNGLLVGFGVTGLSGVATVSAASMAGIVPGTYSADLVASFAGNSLFSTSSTAANLTITPAPLTIAANNANKTYGTADPAFSATYTGFVSGEGPANLGGTLVFSTNEPASGFAPAGSYVISLSGLTSTNYAITFAPGTLAVIPATTSTILAASTASSTYGQSVTLTATVTAAAPCPATPTGGTVTFMVDGKALATAALSGGTATLSTTAIAAGAHGLSAVYNGDGADFATSTSLSLAGAIITTSAGNGTAGYSGNGGAATAAELNTPYAVAVDANGDVFIADYSNNRIREVNPSGVITSIAGNGTAGFFGDNGQATAAELDNPCGLFVDSSGHLFIADATNNRIREVNLSTGIITTVAGGGASLGDGGQATAAKLSTPLDVIEDTSGHLFISEWQGQRIREVNLATGIITTIAGNGTTGYAGDGGQATAAELYDPLGMVLDASGNLYIADEINNRVREVNLSTGIITTVAGNGTGAYGGDGGQATAAEIWSPTFLAVDAAGDLLVSANCRIREVNLSSGVITTIAGNGTASYAGDGGPATAAALNDQMGIALDATGRVFIADTSNNRVRVLAPAAPPLTLSVTPAPLTVTANNQSKVYGAANPSFTASYTGFVNGDSQSVLSGSPSLTTTATTASGVGSYTITAAAGTLSNANYSFTYVNGTLAVTPAPLTVTANNQSKVYGAANPSFTASYTGFVNGDSQSVLSGSPSLTTTATTASGVGSYTITAAAGTLSNANYSFTYVNGTLSVTPAPLTVTANNQSKVYGAANPSFTASYTGFVNGDSQSVLSGGPSLTTTATTASGVGSYTITAAAGTLSAANYSFSTVNGTLTVTPAPLTVTANNQSKVYGAANPSFTASYTGFVNGDSQSVLSGSPNLTTTATTASGVGTYTITAAAGTLSAANYSFSYVNGTLAVTKAPLTVTANNQSKVYGAANPSFTASYTGFVNGDSQSVLSGSPNLTTTATTASGVGSYTITAAAGTLSAANYSFSYVNGTLAVTKAPLTVTANNQSKVYGAANPSFTASYTGFVNGDTSSVLSGGPSLSTTATTASGVGSYTITAAAGTLSAANYSFSTVNGTLTVSPAALTVTANNQSMVYETTLPVLTASYSGFVNGDTSSVLSGSPSLTTTATVGSPVGSYTITAAAGTLAAQNYTFTFANGTLIVTAVAPSVDLNWSGAGTSLDLTELTAGATPGIVISEPSSTANLLQINLGGGYVFAAASTTSATGLTYQNPGSPSTSQYATIDISVANNISSLLAALPGDGLTLGPIYDFNAGVGSTTASAGTIAVAGVSTSSTNGNVSLSATGNLTVNTATALITGSGTLSLAADITAAGTGYNGVGTLAIQASSILYAGSINLRGAAMSIDPTATIGSSSPLSGGYVVSTLAGSAGQAGSSNGTGSAARFNDPWGVAVDSAGNVYVGDKTNQEIREVSPAGVVTTLAGDPGVAGTSDGTGSAARFDTPHDVAVDSAGNVYVADNWNMDIRKITPAGVVITLAGDPGVSGSSNGTGSAAEFYFPQGVALDSVGNVYVADDWNDEIRKITPSGVVTTLAGSAESVGSSNGTGSAARFDDPLGVAVDSAGNVFVADELNDEIRKITAAGAVTTLAGSAGQTGSSNGTGSGARFDDPTGVAVDSAGNVYVADTGNDEIREISPSGVVSTVAGSAGQTGSSGGVGSAARFSGPTDVAVDSAGNIYVADAGNNEIRKITPLAACTGQVTIRSSLPSIPMSLGGGANDVAGINLTDAELASIETTSTGAITIGDSTQTGNITFTTATPATTAGASTVVVQSATGAGQIILNDNAGSGTALNGNGGTVTLMPGTGGVQVIQSSAAAGDVALVSGGFTCPAAPLSLSLNFAPTAGTQFTVVSDTATPAASNPISGTFSNLPQGGLISASYGGKTYSFTANYNGGDGNDLVLTAVSATTTQIAAPSPSVYGQSVTFTATVTANGSPVTGGTVTFSEGSTVLASAVPVGVTGQASFSIATLSASASPYTVLAVYYGTSQYLSSSGSVSQTVTPAPLTVAANNQTTVYGAAIPSFTASYTGFVNGDSQSVLSGSPSLTTTATTASGVGSYTITAAAGTLSAANYSFSTVNGTLSVTQAPLTVTANNQSMVYGTALPTFTASYTGFVNGDSQSVLSGTPSLTTTATTASGVGSYAVIAATGSLSAANYSFIYVNGTLTVTPAGTTTSLSASANPARYGQPLTLTATIAAAAAATGTVTFYDGSTSNPPLQTVAVSTSGGITTARFSTSGLSAGVHTILAVFSDPSGDFQSSQGSQSIQVLSAPVVQSIVTTTTGLTNSTHLTYTVTFSASVLNVAAADFQLTTTGTAAGIVSAISGSGASYTVTVGSIGGDGTLRLDLKSGTTIEDAAGNPVAAYAAGTTVSLDHTPPISSINALPTRETSLSFQVSVTGSDPAPVAGGASGVTCYDEYVSVNGGAWTYWQTIPVVGPFLPFTGQSNNTYSFYSVAHDAAGNVQSKAINVTSQMVVADACTYVPDLTPPSTLVTNVTHSTATFTVNFQGTDAGGSGLASFAVWVQVDGAAPQSIATVNAGTANSTGLYSGSVVYQALADGNAHTYRFFSEGIDGAGNVEPSHAAPNDVQFSATFAAPVSLAVTNFNVQKGAAQRSFIQYLDTTFNGTANLAAIANLANNRIKLIHYTDTGSGGTAVSLQQGEISVSGQVIEINFGSTGLGGAATTNAADGYYALEFDLAGNGSFAAVDHFYRLLGNTNGDRTVNAADTSAISAALGQSGTNLNTEITGDSVVSATDRTLAAREVGQTISANLPLDD